MRWLPILLFGLPGTLLAQSPPLEAIVKPAEIEFRADGKLVTRYRYAGTVQAEKGAGTKPLAKPYCYPLLTPTGVAVTRGWPVERGGKGETTDHFHQKSLWFCHGDVIAEGITWTPKSRDPHVKGVDFWTEAAGHGRIVCDRVDPVQTEPNAVAVTTHNRWLTPSGDAILKETRTIRLRQLAGVNGPVIEFDIELTALVPVTFGDTKEGSFGVRVADGLCLTRRNEPNAVRSSKGTQQLAPAKDPLPMWGEQAAWHDYTGAKGGVAIFDAPTNPYPAAWHTRAYGLMAANPFARAGSGYPGLKKSTQPLVKLAPGERIRLRYGVYPHAPGADVAAAYAAWK